MSIDGCARYVEPVRYIDCDNTCWRLEVVTSFRGVFDMIFNGMLTSIAAEFAARDVRDRLRANAQSRATTNSKWHSLATSAILANMDRKPIVVTETAKSLAPSCIREGTYDAEVYDNTFEDKFNQLTGATTWLNLSPERRELAFVSFKSFENCEFDFPRYSFSWLSLLCTDGDLWV